MLWTHLALVAEEPQFGPALQAHLRSCLTAPTVVHSFADVREILGPEADTLLVCAVASPADADRVVRLVRDVHLRRWPSSVLVVEARDAGASEALDVLGPYLAGRFRWPDETAALTQFVQRRADGARSRRDNRLLPLRGGSEDAVTASLSRHLLAQTPSLLGLLDPLALAASHDVTVLLTGETGTGKTHLAHLIHSHSTRRAHALTVVPCGALAPSLLESEFFGHARGAFTGADRAKVGKFEAAGQGTLLLDEIDTLGREQQGKLLRAIETGEFEPVGSNETRRCQARVIAASNWDLEEAVERGKFRRDLYYRLNVLALWLPPLRERLEDIGPLARGMAARYSNQLGKPLFGVSDEAVAALQAHPWPGNIRQLENVMQQAVLRSTGPELLRRHLPQAVLDAAARETPETSGRLLERSRDEHERDLIARVLSEAGDCRSRAAAALGISRGTLYNKLRKYGITKVTVFRGRVPDGAPLAAKTGA